MDLVFDQGLALFAGLNVVPKTTYRRVEETRCTLDFPWLSFRACGPQDLMKIC